MLTTLTPSYQTLMNKIYMDKEYIDKLEYEIMEWFYRTCEVNFDAVGMVQDATELRSILDYFLLSEKNK